jgi:hypothetical protein
MPAIRTAAILAALSQAQTKDGMISSDALWPNAANGPVVPLKML